MSRLFPVAAKVMPSSQWCQRWTAGRHSWRHLSESARFQPERYRVEPVADAAARTYIVANHYAGTYPAAVQRYGLWEGPRLAGVALLGVPTSAATLTNVFPSLDVYRQSLVLSRFVLADDVPANGESCFLARVFAQAAAAGVRGVVSFADPVPRRVGGRLLFPGHVGHIYQAVGGVFIGRSSPRTMTLLPTGEILNERSKSKVRARERGHEAVERRLVALGASPPQAGQQPAQWLAQALDDVGAVPLRHGGQYRYAWRLGDRAERRQVHMAILGQPYPKTRAG